jgi:signal transduction histidine kinase
MRRAHGKDAPATTRRDERATMAVAAAFLFGMGATLVALSIVVPHASNTDELGVAIPVAIAYLAVGVLLWGRHRFPPWAYVLAVALGVCLMSVGVGFGGDAANAYALLYVWATLYAGYFFSWRMIAALAVLSALGYALALGLSDASRVPGIYWMMMTGTASIAGLLIGTLTRRVRAQASDLVAVGELAKRLSDLSSFEGATCARLRESVGADAVVLLERGDDALAPSASVGADEAVRLLEEPAVRTLLSATLAEGRARPIGHDRSKPGHSRLPGNYRGLLVPVVRGGEPVGVLALVWLRPRLSIGERIESAARLYATEIGEALDRDARLARERTRRAMEINDNVIQGLVLAKYAVDAGKLDQGQRAIGETLERAREIADEHLRGVVESGGEISAGTLVRERPGALGAGKDR